MDDVTIATSQSPHYFPFGSLAQRLESLTQSEVQFEYLSAAGENFRALIKNSKIPALICHRLQEIVVQGQPKLSRKYIILLDDIYKNSSVGRFFVAHEIAHLILHYAKLPAHPRKRMAVLGKLKKTEGLNFFSDRDDEADAFAIRLMCGRTAELVRSGFSSADLQKDLEKFRIDSSMTDSTCERVSKAIFEFTSKSDGVKFQSLDHAVDTLLQFKETSPLANGVAAGFAVLREDLRDAHNREMQALDKFAQHLTDAVDNPASSNDIAIGHTQELLYAVTSTKTRALDAFKVRFGSI